MATKVLAVLEPPTPESGQSLYSAPRGKPPVTILTNIRNRAAVLANDLVWLYTVGTQPNGTPGHYYGDAGDSLGSSNIRPSADLVEGAEVHLVVKEKGGLVHIPCQSTISGWAICLEDIPVWFGDNSGYPELEVSGRLVEPGKPRAGLQSCGLITTDDLRYMGSSKNTFFKDLWAGVDAVLGRAAGTARAQDSPSSARAQTAQGGPRSG